jgi:type IV pilus biogenesis protein CpaD/CtpE
MGAMLSLAVAGCGKLNTPSMMNTSPIRLSDETDIRQIPVAQAGDGTLQSLARDYQRYGDSVMNISLLYNPASKDYGKGAAFKDLARVKDRLEALGVRTIKADILEAPETEPMLVVHYDAVRALAPEGCRPMPGLTDGKSTREIGDYKFGCTVDMMLAKQIYRPSDLAGRGETDAIDGRRATNNTEYYRQVTQGEAEEELRVYSREDVSQ